MIILIATFQAIHGKSYELEAAFRGMIEPTTAEQGALEYRLHRSLERNDTFFFYEKYADKAAMDLHLASSHFAVLMEKVQPMLAGAPQVDTLEFLEGIPERG